MKIEMVNVLWLLTNPIMLEDEAEWVFC